MKLELNIHKELSNIIHNELEVNAETIEQEVKTLLEKRIDGYIDAAFKKFTQGRVNDMFEKAVKEKIDNLIKQRPRYGEPTDFDKLLVKVIKESIDVKVVK